MCKKIPVEKLHESHPQVRAADWRSPLVDRLLEASQYTDGEKSLTNSYRPPSGSVEEHDLILTWEELKEDHDLCTNTYQTSVITEFATLGLACILLTHNAGLEVTEVCRRGDRTDYWLGERESLVEISGQQTGNLDTLCENKAVQLLENPFKKGGYVCVANYNDVTSRLWYFDFEEQES